MGAEQFPEMRAAVLRPELLDYKDRAVQRFREKLNRFSSFATTYFSILSASAC